MKTKINQGFYLEQRDDGSVVLSKENDIFITEAIPLTELDLQRLVQFLITRDKRFVRMLKEVMK